MLLIEGTSEKPLGIEGGGRVREKLSLTRTDKGCGGLNLCETQTSKTTFTAVNMVSLTWEYPSSLTMNRDGCWGKVSW